MIKNSKLILNYESIKDLEKSHENIVDLVNNSTLPRTLTDQRNILKLQLKGLDYFESLYNTNSLVSKDEFTYDDFTKNKLVEIGLILEKKELLVTNNENVLLKTKNQLNLESSTLELEEHLTLGKEKKLSPNKQLPKLKLDPELENKATPETEEPSKIKTNINEESVTKELTERAKMDGDVKVVKLDSTYATSNGQIAASLVVDLSVEKISNVIQSLDEKLNPKEKADPVIKKEEKETNNKTKKDLPKPTPKNNIVKKKEDNPKLDISAINKTIAELSSKFREKQEAGIILDQERFETVLKPQVPIYQDKKIVSNNVFAIRSASKNGQSLDSITDNFGVEERRINKIKP